MAYVYATLIVNEYKTFEEVPRKLQNKTKEILLNMGLDENGNPLD